MLNRRSFFRRAGGSLPCVLNLGSLSAAVQTSTAPCKRPRLKIADLQTAMAHGLPRELEPFRLLWLEEPVPPENVDALRDVRESAHIPICCGENRFLRQGFRELLEKRAVDIVTPDIQKCGGLLEARKIADMAHTYYVPIAPHCQASPLGTMASCHVLAAVPNFLVLEWHWGHPSERMLQWKQYAKEGEIIEKGYVTVPDRPGIGIELNDEYIRKLQKPDAGWFKSN